MIEYDCHAMPEITFSIVSHGQGDLIGRLLDDLLNIKLHTFEVILTLNIPEDEEFVNIRPYPLSIIRNSKPRGFGANHNLAFRSSKGNFFFVVNPDIRLIDLDFSRCLSLFERSSIAAVVPKVLAPSGRTEDSIRRFPSPYKLLRRVFFKRDKTEYEWSAHPFEVEWAAGMFMIFRPTAFKLISGFDDERYFMYFEDVDICWRLRASGWAVTADPGVSVEHDARRAARKSLDHFWWFISSAVAFFLRRYIG